MIVPLSDVNIENTLRVLGRFFKGVFASDTIPPNLSPPFAIIVNYDVAADSGSHWTAIICLSSSRAEYMDSFGRDPPRNGIADFLSKFRHVYINRVCIQRKASVACGHFCIFYVLARYAGLSPAYIMKQLLKLGASAEDFVHEVYKNTTTLL
jgi:hypothetical protein